MEAAKKERIHRYVLTLNGIFGRNRTSKFKVIALLDLPPDVPELTEYDIGARVDRALHELKLKSGRWQAAKRVVDIERIDGVTFEIVPLGADRTLLTGVR